MTDGQDNPPELDGLVPAFKVGDRVRALPDDDTPDEWIGRQGVVLAVAAPDDVVVELYRSAEHPAPDIEHFRRDQITLDGDARKDAHIWWPRP